LYLKINFELFLNEWMTITPLNLCFETNKKKKTRYGNDGIIPSIDKLQGTGGVDIEVQSKNDEEENPFENFMPPSRKSKNQQNREMQEEERILQEQHHQQLQQQQQQQQQQQRILQEPVQQQQRILQEPFEKKEKGEGGGILKTKTKLPEFETFVRFILPLMFFVQLVILFRVYFKK
jgi:hypothetical protein